MKSLAVLGNELFSGRTSIPFVPRRRIWYAVAVLVIVVSATLVATVGLNPGIDFKGGTEVTVTGVTERSEAPANDVLADLGLASGSRVTTMGSSSVRVQTNELSSTRSDELTQALAGVGLLIPDDRHALLAAVLHHRVAAHDHRIAEGAGIALRRVVHADEIGACQAVLEHSDGSHGIEAQTLRKAHHLVAKLLTVLCLEHRRIATGQHQDPPRATSWSGPRRGNRP